MHSHLDQGNYLIKVYFVRGPERIAVLWSQDDRFTRVNLPDEWSNAIGYDALGREIDDVTSNLCVGATPVYLRFVNE